MERTQSRQIAFSPGEGRSSWSPGCPSWRTSAGIFIGRGLRNTSAPELEVTCDVPGGVSLGT